MQNALKFLLQFGKVSMYLGYSALEDFFPSWEIKPNVTCEDKECVNRQKEFQMNPVNRQLDFMTQEDDNHAPLHEETFGIEIVEETAAGDLVDDTEVTHGLRSEYKKPQGSFQDAGDNVAQLKQSGESLEELMSRMKNL